VDDDGRGGDFSASGFLRKSTFTHKSDIVIAKNVCDVCSAWFLFLAVICARGGLIDADAIGFEHNRHVM